MPKTTLEQMIQDAASKFALQVVELVKGASLQELLALQVGLTTRPRKARGSRVKTASTTEPETKKKIRKKRTAKKHIAKKRIAKKRIAKKRTARKSAAKKK